jgi:hypothetical protein
MKFWLFAPLLLFSLVLSVGTVSVASDQSSDGGFFDHLKSFFHGAPPPPLPPEGKAASVVYAPGGTPDKQVLDFMLAFAEALRSHDGAPMKSRLSDKYTVENMMGEGSASDFFMQAIGRIQGPEEIVITSVEKEDDVRVVKMDFHSKGRPIKQRTFKFDSAGKLLSADFFIIRVHGA